MGLSLFSSNFGCGAVTNMDKLPNDVLESIFCYVNPRTLFCCARVCKRWSQVLESGDSKIWRSRLYSLEIDHDIFEYTNAPLVRDLPTAKAKVRTWMCKWIEEDSSETLYMKDNFLTVHRNPVAKSSDAIRSECGFRYGRHRFIIVFHGPGFGSHAMIGICTKQTPVRIRSYDNLLGMYPNAWGWDLVNNKLLHNNESYGDVEGDKPALKDKLGMTVDIEKGTLEFDLNGVPKEAHFTNVDVGGKAIYPTMSAVYGNCEISMVYCGPLRETTAGKYIEL